MANKIETLEKRIETILKDRADELSELHDAVSADRQKAAEASKAFEAATAANDIEAYRKAKSEKEFAADLAALHEARANMLQNKELITEEEYTTGRDAVIAEVNAQLENSKDKAAGLLAQLEAIADADAALVNRANNVLLKWQQDIYHDPALIRNGVVMRHRLAHVEYSPVHTLANGIRERADYQQITGKR